MPLLLLLCGLLLEHVLLLGLSECLLVSHARMEHHLLLLLDHLLRHGAGLELALAVRELHQHHMDLPHYVLDLAVRQLHRHNLLHKVDRPGLRLRRQDINLVLLDHGLLLLLDLELHLGLRRLGLRGLGLRRLGLLLLVHYGDAARRHVWYLLLLLRLPVGVLLVALLLHYLRSLRSVLLGTVLGRYARGLLLRMHRSGRLRVLDVRRGRRLTDDGGWSGAGRTGGGRRCLGGEGRGEGFRGSAQLG